MRHARGVDETQEVVGYRVLRRIARGVRTTVLLAHGGDPAETIVLKVAAADDPGGLREAAALERGAGAHVVALLDASASDDEFVLVLPRLSGDLAHLLAERIELEGGEAVTVLAPIASTIRRLHAAGVAHGALAPASVMFDDEGAPVLTGFGAAAVFAASLPEVELERVPEVGADRAALRELADAVLGRVGGARRAAAQALLAHVLAVPDAEVAGRLAAGIFEVAAALPVRPGDATPPTSGIGRIVPVAEPTTETARDRASSSGWAARVEEWLDSSPAAALKAAALLRWRRLPPGRRRLVLGAGAGALALVVALVAVPSAPTPGASAGAPTATRSAARTPTPSGSPTPSSGETAVLGDDPVAAADALLATRAACRQELSILCFDDVDQDGSAAADVDRSAIRAAQAGGELEKDPLPPADTAKPTLTERIGGSALIGLADGSSLLLVRGDGGWRIRDVLTAPGQASTPSPEG
jgi:hypothetical protein